MSRSLGIVAVGAVCLGALGAAITLPALVLGGSEAPPVGLALAGSGTHTVVHAQPLPTQPLTETGFAPTFVPSLVPPASAVPIAAPAFPSRGAATPVSISRPKDRRTAPKPKPDQPKPAKPEPAEPVQTLSALSEKNKHAKPKKSEHPKPAKTEPKKAPKAHVEHPKSGPKDEPKGHKEHTKSAPKPKQEGGPKSKDKGGKPPKDESGKPPKDHEDKPPKNEGDKGSDAKGPKH
ncbi:MAG TPA: hypothetical protein VGJ27_07250 [Gaiellaceae bacterium]